jgi:hypothetical protein
MSGRELTKRLEGFVQAYGPEFQEVRRRNPKDDLVIWIAEGKDTNGTARFRIMKRADLADLLNGPFPEAAAKLRNSTWSDLSGVFMKEGTGGIELFSLQPPYFEAGASDN